MADTEVSIPADGWVMVGDALRRAADGTSERYPAHPALTGLFVEVGSTTTFVTTDSYRMAVAEFEVGGEAATFLVDDARTVRPISLTDIEVHHSDDSTWVAGQGWLLVPDRLAHHQFPSWRSLVPKEVKVKRTMRDFSQAMRAAVDLVRARDTGKDAFAVLSATPKGLAASWSKDEDTASVTLGPTLGSASTFKAAFKARYLADLARAFDEFETVTIGYVKKNGAVTFTGKAEGVRLTYLLMPIRL